MRLIDVDVIDRNTFVKQVGENDGFISFGDCLDMLNNQPTAYDVDAVVEKLRESELCPRCANNHNTISYCATFCDLGKKLEFVRKGGVDNE